MSKKLTLAEIKVSIEKLMEALEKRGGVRPAAKMRSGCIMYTSDHELSEEELDKLWMDTFGHL